MLLLTMRPGAVEVGREALPVAPRGPLPTVLAGALVLVTKPSR